MIFLFKSFVKPSLDPNYVMSKLYDIPRLSHPYIEKPYTSDSYTFSAFLPDIPLKERFISVFQSLIQHSQPLDLFYAAYYSHVLTEPILASFRWSIESPFNLLYHDSTFYSPTNLETPQDLLSYANRRFSSLQPTNIFNLQPTLDPNEVLIAP